MHYSVDKEATCKANDGTLKMNAKLNSFQVSGKENLSLPKKKLTEIGSIKYINMN